jgi:hypothetical protein
VTADKKKDEERSHVDTNKPGDSGRFRESDVRVDRMNRIEPRDPIASHPPDKLKKDKD